MEMISSTWSCNHSSRLVGCGVDVEAVARFDRLMAPDHRPMPFVFTERETTHALQCRDGAKALCLSFTCKEALFKAARRPYDFTACEVLPGTEAFDTSFEGEITLDPALKAEWHVLEARVRAILLPTALRELMSVVYLFSEEYP